MLLVVYQLRCGVFFITIFNGKELKVSDTKKGIAIGTVCKKIKDPIQDKPPSMRFPEISGWCVRACVRAGGHVHVAKWCKTCILDKV